MKFSYDENEICTLSEMHKDIIKHDIYKDIFDIDMRRRAVWVIRNLFNRSLIFMKNAMASKWEELGIKSLPSDEDELADLIIKNNVVSGSYKESWLAVDDIKVYEVLVRYKNMIHLATGKDADELIMMGIKNILNEKIKQCGKRLRETYEHKMREEKKDIPLDDEEFVAMSMARSDYQDRDAREKKSKEDKAAIINLAENAFKGLLGK